MQKPNRVWIIDDDRSIRWVLEKSLQQAGLETRSFESGEGIIDQLSRDTPDAIVSDIRMPGIDGLALLEKIHASHPTVPVIIMTAHSDLDSAVQAYQGGAFEYLPKPFDLDEVIARLSMDILVDQVQLKRLKKRKLMLKDQLERNARLLETVLDDFNVKGEITAVRTENLV